MRRLGLTLVVAAIAACGDAGAPAFDAFTPSSNPLLSNGRPADAVVGQGSFAARDIGTTNGAGVVNPVSIASEAESDGTIQLWVADRDNNRVLGWRTSASVDLTDGASADIVLGQSDLFSSDGRGIPVEFRLINPAHVAIDSDLNVYVSAENQVWVYEDPFGSDTLPDYSLDDLGSGSFGAWKAVPFGTNLLAVHNRREVRFYRRGSPSRITDATDLNANSTLRMPGACQDIAAVAGGSSSFYIACTLSSGSCPGAAIDPANCSFDGTNFNASCFSGASCGTIHGYRYVSTLDSGDDPNLGTGLPVANTLPAVFSGFRQIRDLEVDLNQLFVADDAFRVLRLNAGEPAASEILTDPNTSNTIDESRGTQNVWVGPIAAGTDPDLDTAFGQGNERAYQQDRGRSTTNGDLSPQGVRLVSEIAVDPAGGLLTVDGGNVRILRYTGATATPQTIASLVLGQPSFAVSFGNAIEANGFGLAIAVAVDWGTDTLYVSDLNAHRILQFTGGVSATTGAAADAVIGQTNFFGFRPNAGLANINTTTLNGPRGLFVDRTTGDLFVKDTLNNRALAFDNPAGSASINGRQYAANAGNTSGEIGGVGGLAARNGSVYVTNGGEVRRYDAVGATETRLYGDGSSTGPNGIALAGDVDFDPSGAMYVSDVNNHRILIFDDPDGTDVLAAITADAVIGQPDFVTVSAGTSRTKMQFPRGIAIDALGRLWVADESNNRVLLFARPREVDPSTGLVTATFVLGQPSFDTVAIQTDDLGFVTASTLRAPRDVATNREGDVVYVADAGNNRVLRFTDSERLRFVDGPGVYEVAPGEVRTVTLTTNSSASFSLNEVNPVGAITLNGSVVTFDATALSAGVQARAQVVAGASGPPPQTIAAAVSFKVVQGNSVPAANPPPARTLPRDDGGCECTGVSGPWLAVVGVIALLRRRRRRAS